MAKRPTINRALGISLSAIAVMALAVLIVVPSLLASILGAGTGDEPRDGLARLLDRHDIEMTKYRARFDGRSVFFIPPARRTVAVIPGPIAREDPTPPEPVDTGPKIPPNYTGPTIRAFLGDQVWFHGDLRVSVGEERDGVKVLSMNPPWSAKIAHAGGEYDVFLFRQGGDFFAEPTAGATAAAPSVPGLVVADTPATDGPTGAGEGTDAADDGAAPTADTEGTGDDEAGEPADEEEGGGAYGEAGEGAEPARPARDRPEPPADTAPAAAMPGPSDPPAPGAAP